MVLLKLCICLSVLNIFPHLTCEIVQINQWFIRLAAFASHNTALSWYMMIYCHFYWAYKHTFAIMALAKSVGGFFSSLFFVLKRFICLFVSHVESTDAFSFFFSSLSPLFFAEWLFQLFLMKDKACKSWTLRDIVLWESLVRHCIAALMKRIIFSPFRMTSICTHSGFEISNNFQFIFVLRLLSWRIKLTCH